MILTITYFFIFFTIFQSGYPVDAEDYQSFDFTSFPGFQQLGTSSSIWTDVSTLECAVKCVEDPTCVSISMDMANKTCHTNHRDEGHNFYISETVNSTFPLYIPQSADQWFLVFKASKGTGEKMYDLWASSNTTELSWDKILLDNSCNCHYKSPLVEKWEHLNIKHVRLSLFQSNEEVVKLVFDGKGSTKMDWFAPDRLTSVYPWNDVVTDPNYYQGFKYFDMEGLFEGMANLPVGCRRFFMNPMANGCDLDETWMFVRDLEANDFPLCPYEIGKPVPSFLYSNQSTASVFANATELDHADVFAVFIKMGN